MILKTKSKENIEAAQSLIDNGYYSSSIHCSYYSCLQAIKHIMIHKYEMSEEDIYHNQKENVRDTSHTYLINFIIKKIRDKSNKIEDFRETNTDLNTLKNTRNESDYQEQIILKEISDETRNTAKRVLSVLKRVKP